MTDQHPITPPQGLLDAWQARIESMGSNIPEILLDVVHWGASEAARAERDSAVRSAELGADQELEACRQWLEINGALRVLIDGLLAARRPKPPSLKQLALARLKKMEQLIADLEKAGLVPFHEADDSIRLALEQLND